ncbi:helix-turn-helix domain-containing protein [Kribbella turkmenica]|uniref:Helix-turn-helix domain-containing protein n=1 Tax=Kribbella turkmenica TaxID=2530375 RepID=A0A4R4XGB1_9ACTN|nr:helix-turn-helix domain-containing protein [Kribbella turkmenica]TDD29780.1 helix-turn-helix domain-containing protein [Kribbella turkmenica]
MSDVFRADDQPVNARADYWHQVVADKLTRLELALPPTPLDGRDRLRVGDLGPVRVVELSTGATMRATRRHTHISTSDPELYKIDVQARGHGLIAHRGREALCAPGDFTLVDLSRPCVWANTPAAGLVAVAFPRTVLPLPADELAALTGVRQPGDDGLAGLVSSLALQLPGRLDSGDGARLGTALVDLLSVLLADRAGGGAVVPPESRRRALLLRIHAFIDAHLGDPALSPRSIAAAMYISVRYLHKLFEGEQTTVVESIRRRRLERCRRDLLDPSLAAVPVGAVAARWGFTTPAHFSRLFRAAYGVPPVELRSTLSRRR